MGLMEHDNLIAGPPATYLPEDTEATAELAAGDDPSAVAARYPTFLAAWAALADQAMERGDAVTSYAFARTGYFDYVLVSTDEALIEDLLRDCSRHRPLGLHLQAPRQPLALPGVRERWKFIEPTLRKAPLIRSED